MGLIPFCHHSQVVQMLAQRCHHNQGLHNELPPRQTSTILGCCPRRTMFMLATQPLLRMQLLSIHQARGKCKKLQQNEWEIQASQGLFDQPNEPIQLQQKENNQQVTNQARTKTCTSFNSSSPPSVSCLHVPVVRDRRMSTKINEGYHRCCHKKYTFQRQPLGGIHLQKLRPHYPDNIHQSKAMRKWRIGAWIGQCMQI